MLGVGGSGYTSSGGGGGWGEVAHYILDKECFPVPAFDNQMQKKVLIFQVTLLIS